MSTTALTAMVGKTIASVTASDEEGAETVTIAFTDGSGTVLTAEAMGSGCACISSVTFKAPATCGILAGEEEIIGTRCADGGTCHHKCETACFRTDGCVPLRASGLTDDWKRP